MKSDLLIFAQKHLDTYEGCYDMVLTSSRVHGLQVWQYRDPEVGGTLVTITKAKVPDFTIEKYKAFKADIIKNSSLID